MKGALTQPDDHAPDGWRRVVGAEVLTNGTHIVINGEPDPHGAHNCDVMGCTTRYHVVLAKHELPSQRRDSDPAPLMSINQAVRTLHAHLQQRVGEAMATADSSLDAAALANVDNAMQHVFAARQDLRDAIRHIYDDEDLQAFVSEILDDDNGEADA